MPRKRYKTKEIVTKLRQVDVLVSQGSGVADAIRQIGVGEVATRTSAFGYNQPNPTGGDFGKIGLRDQTPNLLHALSQCRTTGKRGVRREQAAALGRDG